MTKRKTDLSKAIDDFEAARPWMDAVQKCRARIHFTEGWQARERLELAHAKKRLANSIEAKETDHE